MNKERKKKERKGAIMEGWLSRRHLSAVMRYTAVIYRSAPGAQWNSARGIYGAMNPLNIGNHRPRPPTDSAGIALRVTSPLARNGALISTVMDSHSLSVRDSSRRSLANIAWSQTGDPCRLQTDPTASNRLHPIHLEMDHW